MSSANGQGTRIFVAKIPANVTEDVLHRYFLRYGSITDVYMPKDPVSKLHRGIGFVTYENFVSLDSLMADTLELEGSTLVIDQAAPKEARSSQISNNFFRQKVVYGGCQTTANDLSMKDETGSQANLQLAPILGPSQQLASVEAAAIPCSRQINGSEKRIFVGRVPLEATPNDMLAYFSQFGSILDVYLPRDSKKASHRGFGFITVANEASAARMTRLRHFLFGREMVVESASPPSEMQRGRPLSECLPSGREELSASVNSYHVKSHPDYSTMPSSTDGWGRKLFVGRIPLEATTLDLWSYFSQFSHVHDVYLPKNAQKRSHRGFGFITFADEVSAEYAFRNVHKIMGQKIILDRAAPLEGEGFIATSLPASNNSFLDGSTPGLGDSSNQQVSDTMIPLDKVAQLKSDGINSTTLLARNSLEGSVLHDPFTQQTCNAVSEHMAASRVHRIACRYRPY